MKHFFISGTGRGIGKALAVNLLRNEDTFVTGLSRNQSIEHVNYKHITSDFTFTEEVKNIEFPDIEEAKQIVLINNAAVIGDILRTGKKSSESIIEDYNVNIIAPTLLMNKFLNKYQNYTNERTILNISSGAARRPIDAWNTYCATKAALDMVSEVIDEEQKFFLPENQVKLFSVAPGVVATRMQEQIRETDENEFSMVDYFIDLKNNNQLILPYEVAEKLIYIVNNREEFHKVLLDKTDFK